MRAHEATSRPGTSSRAGGRRRSSPRRSVAPLAAALILGLTGSAQAAAPNFAAPANITVGTGPTALALGTFDAGATLDLAVANGAANSITAMTGNGAGAFTAGAGSPFTLANGANPSAIIATDLTGDGKTDLAFANAGTNTVQALVGNGAGGFTLKPAVGVGNGTRTPVALAVGSFNTQGAQADTSPDLAVVNRAANEVAILLGDGTGGFSNNAQGSPFAVGTTPVAIVSGNFGNNAPDLAVANQGSNNVSVLVGTNVKGNFGNATNYPAGTAPSAIAIGDFNGDGKVDLVVANKSATGAVSVLLGNGDATFQAPISTLAGSNLNGITVADFNGDGKQDVAVTQSGGGVLVLAGQGNGHFDAPVSFSTGTSPTGIAAGDVDSDGAADLVVANQGSNNVSVLLNTTPVSISVTPTATVTFPALAPLASSTPLAASVSVTSNDPRGYQLSVTRSVFSNGDIPLKVALASAPSGTVRDLTSLSDIPCATGSVGCAAGVGLGSLNLAHRGATAFAPLTDIFPTTLTLGPVPYVGNGGHQATVTFTVIAN